MATWEDFQPAPEPQPQDPWAQFQADPQAAAEQPGYGQSLLSAAGRGFASVVPGVVGGVGYLTGSEGLVQTAEDIEQSIAEALPINPAFEDDFAMKAASTVGQVGSILATGGAAGVAGKALQGVRLAGQAAQAIPYATGVLQGIRGGGQEAEQYGMEGAAAYGRALAGGAIEGLVERLPFGMLTETAAARRLLGEAVTPAGSAVREIASGIGTEATEEGLAQIGGNVATMGLAPAGVETPGLLEGVGEAAALGAVGGAAFGGVNALVRGRPQTIESGEAEIPESLRVAAEAGAFPNVDELENLAGAAATEEVAAAVRQAAEISPTPTYEQGFAPSQPEAGVAPVGIEAAAPLENLPVSEPIVPESRELPVVPVEPAAPAPEAPVELEAAVTPTELETLVPAAESVSAVETPVAPAPLEEALPPIAAEVTQPQPEPTEPNAPEIRQIIEDGQLQYQDVDEGGPTAAPGSRDRLVEGGQVAAEGQEVTETEEQRFQRIKAAPALARTKEDVDWANAYSRRRSPPPTPVEAPTVRAGFLERMTPMQRTKAEAALKTNMVRRNQLQSRREIVEEMVSSGATIQPHPKDKRRLMLPDGSFIEESRLTKTGMDYAEFLLSQAPAAVGTEQVAPALPIQMVRQLTSTAREVVPAGPSFAEFRQRVLEAVTGQKVPKTKAGVGAVESALYAAFGINQNQSKAGKDADLRQALLQQAGLLAVATNTATPEQVEPLVQRGLVRTINGQNVITDAGVALMPPEQRPRLTEAERVAEIQQITPTGVVPTESLPAGQPTPGGVGTVASPTVNRPQTDTAPPSEPPLPPASMRTEQMARKRRGKAGVPQSVRDQDGAAVDVRVTPADAQRAREIEGKQIPGVSEAWVGTTDEFLAEFGDLPDFNQSTTAVRADGGLEAFYDPKMDRAFILIDRAQAREGDARRAVRYGTSTGIETVRRLLRHEAFAHRGWRALPTNLKTEFINLLPNLITPDDIDSLVAKGYARYANWREDPLIYYMAAEEWLATRIERISKLPRAQQGKWTDFMDWLKRVFQWLTGDDTVEPTPKELTDIMRQMVRALETREAQAPESEPAGLRPSYAGVNAQMSQFMRDSLETARDMAATGKSGEEIRAVTGWFPGAYDGKMRWEIPDNKAAFVNLDTFRKLSVATYGGEAYTRLSLQTVADRIKTGNYVRLADVLTHPLLFEAYPQAANIPFFPIAGNIVQGSHRVVDGNSVITATVVTDDGRISDESLSVLLHELQHYIQLREGFASGGSPDSLLTKADLLDASKFRDAYKAIQSYRKEIASLVTTLEKERAKAGFMGFGGPNQKLVKSLEDKIESIRNSINSVWKAQGSALNTDQGSTRAALLSAINKVEDELGSSWVLQKRSEGLNRIYKLLAGEIEARDIQARRDMTPEQRQATAPYSSENIAPDDAMVVFNAPDSVAASIRFSLNDREQRLSEIANSGSGQYQESDALPFTAEAVPGRPVREVEGQTDIARNLNYQETKLDETQAAAIKFVDNLGPVETWFDQLANPAWQQKIDFDPRSIFGQYVLTEAVKRTQNTALVDPAAFTANRQLADYANATSSRLGGGLGARAHIHRDPRYIAMFATQGAMDLTRKQQKTVIDPQVNVPQAVEAVQVADQRAREQATTETAEELDLDQIVLDLGMAALDPTLRGDIREINNHVLRIGTLQRLRQRLTTGVSPSLANLSAADLEAQYAGLTVEQIDALLAQEQEALAARVAKVKGAMAGKPKQRVAAADSPVEQARKLIDRLEAAPSTRKPRPNPVRDLYKKHLTEPMAEVDFIRELGALGVPAAEASRLYAIAQVKLAAVEVAKQGRQERGVRRRLADLMDPSKGSLLNALNRLRGKVTGDVNWSKIFEAPFERQQQWRVELYRALRADPALANLTPQEARDLAAEVDRIWNLKRQKAFDDQMKRVNLPGVKPEAKKKVQESAPQLLRYINVGTFGDDSFRQAVSKKFGIKALSADEIKRITELAQAAQAEGISTPERSRILDELVKTLQSSRNAEIGEILSNYWVTSVLSGFRTQFDTALAFLNGLRVMSQGVAYSAITKRDFKLAGRAAKDYFKTLADTISEAVAYFVTGDPTLLDGYQYGLQTFFKEGVAASAPYDYFEQVIKSKDARALAKFSAYFMAGVQRAMRAFDHINSVSTTEGWKSLAVTLDQKRYRDARLPTPGDVEAARKKALDIVGSDKGFTNRAKVSAATRQILNDTLNQEFPGLLDEAREIGLISSYQNDPTGIGGIIYHTLLGVTNKAVQAAGKFRDQGTEQRAASEWSEARKLTDKALRGILYGLAVNSRNITGTRFVRFAGNRFNELLSFLPGAGLLRLYEKDMNESKRAMLITNNLVGGMLSVAMMSIVLRMLSDEEDDEKRGFRLEGSWANLTPDQKNQLRSQGRSPYTLSFYDGDGKWSNFNYNSWPVAGILAAAGTTNDLRQYAPEKWDAKDMLDRFVSAAWAGVTTFKDLSALSGLMDLLGTSAYASGDPVESAKKWAAKFTANFGGGFIPRAVKDIDAMMDPEIRKPDDMAAYFAKEVPFFRRLEVGGQKLFNIFGEPVQINRQPWSRSYTQAELDDEYRTLGELNSRGLFLGAANPTNRTIGSGPTRRELTDREAELYMQTAGKFYKDYIRSQGERLLRLPNEQAKKAISQDTERLRNAALRRAVSEAKKEGT